MPQITNNTKIVATIGPASSSKEVLKDMILSGLNVVRLNFSHGAHEIHKLVIDNVRSIDSELGTCTAILADLQGPKLRIGEVANEPVELVAGSEIIITTVKQNSNAQVLYTNYAELPRDVKSSEKVLIDDGKIVLRVIESDAKSEVKCVVEQGGPLFSKKGLNLPNTKISKPSLSEK
ncbi:MAG: hypothetical protein RL220_585, partial [Bacteroidota bacterium]